MAILNLLMLIYIIYILFYLLALLILLYSNPNFSINKNTVSSLSILPKPKNIVFNILTSLYGILGLSSLVKFIISNEINLYIIVCSIFWLFICIGTFLIGIFPVNIDQSRHNIIAKLLFPCLLIVEVLFTLIFIVSTNYKFVSVFGLLLFIITIILLIKAKNIKAGTKYAFWEWLTLIGTMIWNIIFALTLLLKF